MLAGLVLAAETKANRRGCEPVEIVKEPKMTADENISDVSPSPGVDAPPGMMQCSVTGQWLPPDDLVMFRGRLVSAQGKALLLDQLRTGVDGPGAFVCAGLLRRRRAIGIDFLVLIGFAYLVGAVVYGIFSSQADRGYTFRLSITLGLATLFAWAYFTVMHRWRGQSLGKMTRGLRVVTLDAKRISWTQATVRSLIVLIGWFAAVALMLVAQYKRQPGMFHFAYVVLVAWLLIDMLPALFDKARRRTMHDRICGTRVIVEI